MNSKLLMAGAILITFGVTLAATAYFNINRWEQSGSSRYLLPTNANSFSEVFLDWDKDASLMKVIVQIEPSGEVADFLNSTMLSTYHLTYGTKPITVTLFSQWNRTVSAAINTAVNITDSNVLMGIQPVHVFDIPDDWSYVAYVRVTNAENYPVIWIVDITYQSLLTNINWQTATYFGIGSIAVGAFIIGIPALTMRQTSKLETKRENNVENKKEG